MTLNFPVYQTQLLVLVILIKIVENKDPDLLCEPLSGETDLQKLTIGQAFVLVRDENACGYGLLMDIYSVIFLLTVSVFIQTGLQDTLASIVFAMLATRPDDTQGKSFEPIDGRRR